MDPQIVTANIAKATKGNRPATILSSRSQGVKLAIRIKMFNVVMIPPATMRYIGA